MNEDDGTTPPQPPAGWYINPDGTDSNRWWDGSQWTEHASAKAIDLPAPPAFSEFTPSEASTAFSSPPPASVESTPADPASIRDDGGSSVAPPGSPATPEPAPTLSSPPATPISAIAPQPSVDGRPPRKPQWAFALIGLVIAVAAAAVVVVLVLSGSGNNYRSQQVAKLIESGGYTGGESNTLEANFTALAGASGATCSASGKLGGQSVYACTWTNDGKTESGRWEFLPAHQPYPAAIGRVSDGGSSGSTPATAAAATTLVNSVIEQRAPGGGGSANCSGPTKATVTHADGLTLTGGVGGDYVCELLDDGSPVEAAGQTFTETWRWASDGVVLEDKDGTSAQASTASGNTGSTASGTAGNTGNTGSGNTGSGNTGGGVTSSSATPAVVAPSGSSYSGTATTVQSGGATDLTSCPGSEAYDVQGTHTSCGFAANVFAVAVEAFKATGHPPGTITVGSPVTHKSYTLTCQLDLAPELFCFVGAAGVDLDLPSIEAGSGTDSGNAGSASTGSGASASAYDTFQQAQQASPGSSPAPPKPGNVCGVYLNINGLSPTTNQGYAGYDVYAAGMSCATAAQATSSFLKSAPQSSATGNATTKLADGLTCTTGAYRPAGDNDDPASFAVCTGSGGRVATAVATEV